MIQLGSFDKIVTLADREAYLRQAAGDLRCPWHEAAEGSDKLSFSPFAPEQKQTMTVSDMQAALTTIGFFPGGKVDGICGYRTRAAMRLFQEYVRSVEKLPSVPDGRFGPSTEEHLQRWTRGGVVSTWAPTIEQWRSGTLGQTEYTDWLSLLGKVKEKYSRALPRC